MKMRYYLLLVVVICLTVYACRKVETLSEKQTEDSLFVQWAEAHNGRWLPYTLNRMKRENRDMPNEALLQLMGNYLTPVNNAAAYYREALGEKLNLSGTELDNYLQKRYALEYDQINSRLEKLVAMDNLYGKYSNIVFSAHANPKAIMYSGGQKIASGGGGLPDVTVLAHCFSSAVTTFVQQFPDLRLYVGYEPSTNGNGGYAPAIRNSCQNSALAALAKEVYLDDGNGCQARNLSALAAIQRYYNCPDTQDPPPGTTPPPTNGGSGYSPTDPFPPNAPSQDDTPCGSAKRAAQQADSVFTADSVSKALAKLGNISTLEKGFNLYKRLKYADDVEHDPTAFDYYFPGEVHTGSRDHIAISDSFNAHNTQAIGFVHTHSDTGYSPPSAVDIGALIQYKISDPGYQSNFTVAYNGDTYAINVTDVNAAQAMQATINSSIDTATHGWKDTSTIGKAFKAAKKYYGTFYKKETNIDNIAYENAMSAVLSKFKMGVTLLKKDTDGHFKPVMRNIVETKNSKGKVVKTDYENVGCP